VDDARAFTVGLRRTCVLVACLIGVGQQASSQTRLRVDPKASLAWWQINPHLGHLWATTCPQEPSWRPGEGRSAGWTGSGMPEIPHGNAGVNDTTIVPLYPRYEALSVCTEAVSGQVLVADTTEWKGIRGDIRVRANALMTGERRRDEYTHQAILQSDKHEEIRFLIDSVVNVSRVADTIRGTAVGTFSFLGKPRPMEAGVQAWPELGGLRVQSKFHIDASDLTGLYEISRFVLGLGVSTKIWYHVFMGVDVVLRGQSDAS
jgi:hypothetical protein